MSAYTSRPYKSRLLATGIVIFLWYRTYSFFTIFSILFRRIIFFFCPCNWNLFYFSVFQFDGVHVVSGSLDTSIRVWDAITGTCKHTLMGHQSLTSGMELRQNILVSGNADSTVKVWDTTNGQCLQTLSGKKSTYKLNFIVITNLKQYFYIGKTIFLNKILSSLSYTVVDQKLEIFTQSLQVQININRL